MKNKLFGLGVKDMEGKDWLESRRESYLRARVCIRHRIQNRIPFSLIRIGDGESVILNWERKKSSVELESHLQLWFANYKFEDHEVDRLKRYLSRAIERAGLIGVPTTRQRTLHARYERTYSCIERLLIESQQKERVIVDAAIHRFLHLSGDILALLRGSEFVGIITCRHVSGELSKVLKPRFLAHYLIPAEAELTSENDGWGQWYPQRYKQLLREVHIPYKGAPFLVGAGLVGKLICEEIRIRGGIAIDIGSVFDGWAGMKSRAYLKNYPEEFYRIDYADKVSQLSDMERLERLASVIEEYEPNNKSLYISERC